MPEISAKRKGNHTYHDLIGLYPRGNISSGEMLPFFIEQPVLPV